MSWLPLEGEKMRYYSRIKWDGLREFIQVLLWDGHAVGLNISAALHKKPKSKTWEHVHFVNDIHTSLLLYMGKLIPP